MASIFSKIVNGDIPCYKVAEDERHLAFLDINPIVEGHTLVIPKYEIDYIFDLDAESLSALTLFAQRVAKAIDGTIECKRVGIAVLGMEVPHCHIHLVPLKCEGDLNLSKPKLNISNERMISIAQSINLNFK
jgi:histidine triad (HIT) family protein